MEDKIIYNDEDYSFPDNDIIFDELFNNEYENKSYIVEGFIGLWDGTRKGYLPYKYSSLKDAIIACNDGFDGYVKVTEDDDGNLKVNINHHDGTNNLQIKELTEKGNELYYKYDDVLMLLEDEDATVNVNFLKNYRDESTE